MEAAATEGRLLTRSCTTGWLDWIHGELWLLPDGLLRVRGSLSGTVAAGTRMQSGAWATVDIEKLPAKSWDQSKIARALKRHRRNYWLPWTDIASARLHGGLTTDRLLITRQDGSRVRLLWLDDDPAEEVLASVLPERLGTRFVNG